jgi:hypothetical protein
MRVGFFVLIFETELNSEKFTPIGYNKWLGAVLIAPNRRYK